MNHADHVRLIAGGIPTPGGLWADMGAGDGAFTLALRDIAGPDVEIIAVDTNQGALRQLSDRMHAIFPGSSIELLSENMTHDLDLKDLDGIIAANSLHYIEHRRQSAVLRGWRPLLKWNGRVVIVEYDADEGNRWVPHPFSFHVLHRIAAAAGYEPPVLLGRHPSSFLNGIYAAVLVPRAGAIDLDD